MEKKEPFGARIEPRIKKQIKMFCVKKEMTVETFIKKASLEYLSKKGRYEKTTVR